LESTGRVRRGPQHPAQGLIHPGERAALQLVLQQLHAQPHLVRVQPHVRGREGQEQPHQGTALHGREQPELIQDEETRPLPRLGRSPPRERRQLRHLRSREAHHPGLPQALALSRARQLRDRQDFRHHPLHQIHLLQLLPRIQGQRVRH